MADGVVGWNMLDVGLIDYCTHKKCKKKKKQ